MKYCYFILNSQKITATIYNEYLLNILNFFKSLKKYLSKLFKYIFLYTKL